MMRYRTLGTPRESCCCLPTPYRIPKAVAGLAFNFSIIELPEVRQRPVFAVRSSQSGTEPSERPQFSFGMRQYSTAI